LNRLKISKNEKTTLAHGFGHVPYYSRRLCRQTQRTYIKPRIHQLRQSSDIGWIDATGKREQMGFHATGSI
jgi:hypothetical protein